MKIAVVSPHRDDAAFSLSLSIGAWIRAGHEVQVINCFTISEYAPFAKMPFSSEDRLKHVTELRLREDASWLRHFPAGLTFLDLKLMDAPLRLRCTADDVCDLPVNPADPALNVLQAALDGLAVDALVIPLALGAHVDHLTARDAALKSSWRAEAVAFYEDLPYATRPGAEEEIEGIAQSMNHLLRPGFAEGARENTLAIGTKYEFALCYPSQIDDIVAHQIAQFCTNYCGRERLWANYAWSASQLALEEISR